MGTPETPDAGPGAEPSSETTEEQQAKALMRDMTGKIGKLSEGQSGWGQWVWGHSRFSFNYNRSAGRSHRGYDETLQLKVRDPTGRHKHELNYSAAGLRDPQWDLIPIEELILKMVGTSELAEINPNDIADLNEAKAVLQQELETRSANHAN